MTKGIFDKTNHFDETKLIKSNLLYGSIDACPNPLVSVIMPVFNRPDTFPKSLQSVLEQKCDFPYEIVVVDDNMNGETTPNYDIVVAAKSNKILYYRHEKNLGMFDNWNRGIYLARGKFITYCHDDDLLLPDALERLIRISQEVGEDKFIFTKYNMIDENGEFINKYAYPHKKIGLFVESEYNDFSLFDHFIGSYSFGVGCLFKRDNMLAIGGFDKEYYPAGDSASLAKYTYYYGSVVTNNPTFNYRIADNNSRNIKSILAIAEMTYAIRLELMRVIKFPDCILRRYADAMHRLTPYILLRNYKVLETEGLPKIHKGDNLIKRIFMSFSRNKGYKLKI